MVDLAILQFIRDTIAIIVGITAFAYYIVTVRNQNKTIRLQMIQRIWEWISSEEDYLKFTQLLRMNWTDYEDFNRKYGANNNPENHAMRWAVMNNMNGLGYLLNEGAIDVETVYDHSGGRIIWLWIKFEPIILEFRKVTPYAMKWWEYLVDKLMVEMKKRGDDFTTIPAGYMGADS
jgi:hypothetical protein